MRLFASCPVNSGHTGFVLLRNMVQTKIIMTMKIFTTMMMMMMENKNIPVTNNSFYKIYKLCVTTSIKLSQPASAKKSVIY
jgi:hypothetical protein